MRGTLRAALEKAWFVQSLPVCIVRSHEVCLIKGAASKPLPACAPCKPRGASEAKAATRQTTVLDLQCTEQRASLAHWQGAGLSNVRWGEGAGLSDVKFCPEMTKIPLKNRLPKGAGLSDVRLRSVRSGFGRCRPQRREFSQNWR